MSPSFGRIGWLWFSISCQTRCCVWILPYRPSFENAASSVFSWSYTQVCYHFSSGSSGGMRQVCFCFLAKNRWTQRVSREDVVRNRVRQMVHHGRGKRKPRHFLKNRQFSEEARLSPDVQSGRRNKLEWDRGCIRKEEWVRTLKPLLGFQGYRPCCCSSSAAVVWWPEQSGGRRDVRRLS